MTNWTSLDDILRDLSVAQGRNVPATLETYGNTPPVLNIEEETEDYLKSCGDVNFTLKPPDLNFIQEMISMVSENQRLIDKNQTGSNLNPLSEEFIPQKKKEMEALWRNKINRNVALKSILERLEKNATNKKPDISNSPRSMFRKKSAEDVAKKSVWSHIQTVNSPSQYTPSVVANEYYNKYLKNSKLKEQNRDHIASEEPIREIYIRRKPSSERKFCLENDSPVNSCSTATEESSEDAVFLLPHHRHLILDSKEDCIVCDIAAKRGYRFTDENMYTDSYKEVLIKDLTTSSSSEDIQTE